MWREGVVFSVLRLLLLFCSGEDCLVRFLFVLAACFLFSK